MDEFIWLEQLEDSATLKWLRDQKERTKQFFSSYSEWKDVYEEAYELLLTERITSLLAGTKGLMFTKRVPETDSSHLCYSYEGGEINGRSIIDSDYFGKDNRISFIPLSESSNGRYLIYGKRYGSKYEYEPAIFDLYTGKHIGTGLDISHYRGVLLINDYLIYARSRNSQWKVYKRCLGLADDSEEIIFDPKLDEIGRVSVSLSDCSKYFLYLIIKRGPPRTAILLRQDVNLNHQPEVVVQECTSFHGGFLSDNRFLYLSSDRASMKRVVLRDLHSYSESVIIEERSISAMRMIISRYCVLVQYVENWRAYIVAFDFYGNEKFRIDFNEPGEISDLTSSSKSRHAYFRYSSLKTGGACFRIDTETGKYSSWANEWPAIQNNQIEIKSFNAYSNDGTLIPIITAYNVRTNINKGIPVLLTAYGGYGAVTLPSSSIRSTMWMKRGGVVAIAAVRGGGEFGEMWRKAGSLENRNQSINDFIAAADTLHKKGFGNPSTLSISGASHAGFLIVAAMVRRPDLFQVVICSSALLDLLALDRSQHGNWAIQEFGSPLDDNYRQILKQISPYYNIRNGVNYPSTLFIAGGEDTIVDPWHIFKMTAKLQSLSMPAKPILLDYSEIYGHRGELPIGTKTSRLANQIVFLMQSLQIN